MSVTTTLQGSIALCLEEGKRGSRFPVFQRHGEHVPPEDVLAAKEELLTISAVFCEGLEAAWPYADPHLSASPRRKMVIEPFLRSVATDNLSTAVASVNLLLEACSLASLMGDGTGRFALAPPTQRAAACARLTSAVEQVALLHQDQQVPVRVACLWSNLDVADGLWNPFQVEGVVVVDQHVLRFLGALNLSQGRWEISRFNVVSKEDLSLLKASERQDISRVAAEVEEFRPPTPHELWWLQQIVNRRFIRETISRIAHRWQVAG